MSAACVKTRRVRLRQAKRKASLPEQWLGQSRYCQVQVDQGRLREMIGLDKLIRVPFSAARK
jgi:hypothetical protein